MVKFDESRRWMLLLLYHEKRQVLLLSHLSSFYLEVVVGA